MCQVARYGKKLRLTWSVYTVASAICKCSRRILTVGHQINWQLLPPANTLTVYLANSQYLGGFGYLVSGFCILIVGVV